VISSGYEPVNWKLKGETAAVPGAHPVRADPIVNTGLPAAVADDDAARHKEPPAIETATRATHRRPKPERNQRNNNVKYIKPSSSGEQRSHTIVQYNGLECGCQEL
jgi:hypothetical protein